ncbi:MAG TPA: type II pantothenate kinase [Lachnoclostridium sp.]|jgi:type II pantothenate kinase|uniref:type II pantothenate kinase n=1 Tax=Lacrimispora sp. TaxID=2719234 RepID=UPI000ED49D41|nr:type II pantothenate kinase [Lacrimispora sp.]HCD46773.1 type II pantothenate kinase [Lachnoclostridium sp.]
MKITIGIDLGGSTTKIVGFQDNKLKIPTFVKADNPIASLFGALGKFIYENNIQLNEIEKIMITGVGSAYVEQPLYGIPTYKVDEFTCNGLGGQYFTGLNDLIVVSMGTGTSLVQVIGDKITHTGGIGIGGGTILGLSSLLLKTQDISLIMELASKGNISNIDLQIQDISRTPLPGLPLTATASNFGKVRNLASDEDIAVGIINMVLQVIGKSAILSSLNSNITNFVMTGNLAKFPQCKGIFQSLETMFHVHFIIPDQAEYGTAIGAALTEERHMEMRQIVYPSDNKPS